MTKAVFLLLMFLQLFCPMLQAEEPGSARIELTAEEQAFIAEHPVIRVANEMDWPPFDFYEFGRPKGFSIDHIKALANQVGVEIEFVNGYSWVELLDQFKRGEIDVLPVFYKNRAREEYALFTTAYHTGVLGIFTGDKGVQIDGVSDLPGNRVGIQKADGSIAIITEQVPGISLVEVENPSDLVAQLATGKLDAIIGNPLLFWYYAKALQVTNIRLSGYVEVGPEVQNSTAMHVGVRKDWPQLQQILQKAMDAFPDQELQRIKSRWTDTHQYHETIPQRISLTLEEQAFVAEHPVIRVSNQLDYPPFDFAVGQEPKGYSIDLLKRVAERLGVELEFVNGYPWEELWGMFERKELDLIHPASHNEHRELFGLFTQKLYSGRHVFITAHDKPPIRSIRDLKGKRFATPKGWAQTAYLQAFHPEILLLLTDGLQASMRAVRDGRAYATMELDGTVQYRLKKEMVTDLKANGYFREFDAKHKNSFYFVVRKDWPLLQQMIIKAQQSFTPQELNALQVKWFGAAKEVMQTVQLTAAEQAYVQAHPVLKVSNEMDYPPYDFTIGAQPQGYSIDLLNLIAARTGLTVTYINGYPWSELVDLFTEGQLDLMHTLTKTAEREKIGLFSAPFRFYKHHWVTQKGAPDIHKIEQLYGKTVAVGRGWNQADFISTQHPQIQLLLLDGLEPMLDAVSSGEADALLSEVPVVQYLFATRGITDLKISGWGREYDQGSRRSFHFWAQKNAPELISILNKGLATLTPMDIEALEHKWFGSAVVDRSAGGGGVELDQEEQAYLAEKKSLRVCTSSDKMPYGGLSTDGNFAGMAADYLALFETRLSIEMQMVATSRFQNALNTLVDGGCEVFLFADMLAAEKAPLDVTTPYLSFPYVIATTHDTLFITDIGLQLDKTYAVAEGAPIIDELRKRYPGINLLEVATPLEGLEAVRDRTAFGYIDTSVTIGYTIQNEWMLDVKIAGQLSLSSELAVATSLEEPLLGSIFQKVVMSLSATEKQTIYNQWVAVKYEQGVDYSLVWRIIIGAVVLLAITLYWNRKLAAARIKIQFTLEKLNSAQELLEKKNEELGLLAITDALTGLVNRMKLDSALCAEIHRNERYDSTLSVIMVDIDHFKNINDRLGHQAGDKVLQDVAAILRDHARQVDVVGRWGGEEFLIICPETDLAGACVIAEKLRSSLESRSFDHALNVTGSFGVAQVESGDRDVDLIHKADDALYRAKENGRNRVETHSY